MTKNNSEKSDLEIQALKPEILNSKTEAMPAVSLGNGKLEVKRGGNVIIGTLNIFANPAKKRFAKHYHPRNKLWYLHIIVDAILYLAVLGLIISNVWFWQAARQNWNDRIEMSIFTEQEKIISGQELTYIIDYENKSGTRLKDAKLSVRLPKGFIFKSTEPALNFDTAKNTFDLAEISAGANGRLKISGLIFGEVGGRENISATLDFLTDGSNRRQQRLTGYDYSINGSLIDLDLTMPEQISNGQTVKAALRYQNQSDANTAKILIETNLKELGFEFFSSSRSMTDGVWVFDSLLSNQDGQIDFSGRFNLTEENKNPEIKAKIFLVLNGQKLLQKEVTQKIAVVHSKFYLELSSPEQIIDLDGETPVLIKYKNSEAADITEVRISLKAKPTVLIANENAIKEITEIKRGESGEIQINLKTQRYQPASAAEKNLPLNIWLEAEYKIKNDPATRFSISSKLVQKIKTDLFLTAFARYFTAEGDQLGRGPVPPVVAKATKYWLFFNLENNYNDASPVVITANLPANVSLTGKGSATKGDGVVFQSATRQVSWKIDKVEAPSQFFDLIGAAIEVEITPRADQIGRTAELLTNIELKGKDDFTGEDIYRKLPDITTNLTSDKAETSDGRVKAN